MIRDTENIRWEIRKTVNELEKFDEKNVPTTSWKRDSVVDRLKILVIEYLNSFKNESKV